MRRRLAQTAVSETLAIVLAYCVCVVACDGGSDPGPITGTAPVVNAGNDRTVDVGQTVMLIGTTNGNTATHKWEFVSRPAGSMNEIQNDRSLTEASFVADQLGEYVVKLIGATSNNPTAPDVNPAATDTVTITAVMPGSQCASLGAQLVMTLTWTNTEVDLQVGGETPNPEPSNDIAANLFGELKDPNCEHDGDEPLLSGATLESATCTPLMSGVYSIQVDNDGPLEEPFMVSVTIDGTSAPGFPQTGSIDVFESQVFEVCVQ
jgi:hypothetical protein